MAHFRIEILVVLFIAFAAFANADEAAAPAAAAPADQPSGQSCETDANASSYLHKGTFGPTGVGSRTWNLLTLAKASKGGDACAQSLYVRALQESQAYWDKINTKYSCGIAADGSKPHSPPATCSKKRMKAVSDSYNWLRIVKTGYPPPTLSATEGTAGCVDCDKPQVQPPLNPAAASSLQDTAAALANAVPPPDPPPAAEPAPVATQTPAPAPVLPGGVDCSKVAAADLRGKDETDVPMLAENGDTSILSCVASARTTLLPMITGGDAQAKLAKAIPVLKGWEVGSVQATLKTDKHDLFLSKQILANLNVDKAGHPDFTCLNDAKKKQLICNDLKSDPADLYARMDPKYRTPPQN